MAVPLTVEQLQRDLSRSAFINFDFRRLSDGIGACADALAREAKSARESIAKRNIIMPSANSCPGLKKNLHAEPAAQYAVL